MGKFLNMSLQVTGDDKLSFAIFNNVLKELGYEFIISDNKYQKSLLLTESGKAYYKCFPDTTNAMTGCIIPFDVLDHLYGHLRVD